MTRKAKLNLICSFFMSVGSLYSQESANTSGGDATGSGGTIAYDTLYLSNGGSVFIGSESPGYLLAAPNQDTSLLIPLSTIEMDVTLASSGTNITRNNGEITLAPAPRALAYFDLSSEQTPHVIRLRHKDNAVYNSVWGTSNQTYCECMQLD